MNSLLHLLHEQAGAEFQDYAGTTIPLTFGAPPAEYAAIRTAAAIVDRAQRGVLELTGRDRLEFLNNLLTNQTFDKSSKQSMPAGRAVYSFLLNPKGRIVADMNVLEFGPRTILETDLRLVNPIRQILDRHLFGEQVKLRVADELHAFVLAGPAALEALNRSLHEPIDPLTALQSVARKLKSAEVLIFRDDICGVPGYHLLVERDSAEAIWRHFTASEPVSGEDLRHHGLARPAGWAAFNATRIEAGRPICGIDFDDSVLPAETGQLDRAVSFTKGCYLGQEIVARMRSRDQLSRQLVAIRMESDALPLAGEKIYDDQQNEIGGVTSSTISPVLSNIAICLGYVKKPNYAAGSRLRIPAEGAMREATVVKSPPYGT